MIETIGWIGAVLLAFCGLPQAYETWYRGNANGVNILFLLAWFLGEALTLAYVLPTVTSPPLIFNYTANLIFVGIILKYKLRPRK